jgi:Carboxypeptidase regulatory-like domain/TonB dependent receptor
MVACIVVSRRASVRLLLVFACLAAPAGSARAQSVTGSIQGVVVDQSGGVLPGVTVTVTDTATGVIRTTATDESGAFRAELLPVGRYELSAELSGFIPRKQPGITLTIGAELTFRIELHVGGVAEAVTVSAQAPIVETTRSQVSDTVGEAAIQNLPVNGRNFINFALLTPGVTTDVRTGDLSFAGQRGTLNSLVVDGADNNNTFFGQTLGRTGSGRAPYQFSAAAVKEFQVNSNAYSAEYGRAGGAVINVVTRSGTNTASGELFDFLRDKSLNANNLINVLQGKPKSPYHYNQFGGLFGGPLRKDRDFVFANYDGQRNTLPNLVFLNLPGATPADASTQAAIATLQTKAGSWNQAQNQDTFLVKTDHQLGSSSRLTLRYNHQNFNGQNFENSGPQNSVEHTGDSNVRTRTFNAGLTAVLRPGLFNEMRVQWARDQEPGDANSSNPEAIVQQAGTTVLTIGRNSFSPRETTISRWQVADALTWAGGAHKVKGGVDFQFDNILNYFPGNFFGSYTFSTLASFAQDQAVRYVQAFAGPGTTGGTTNPDIKEYSFFAQDEWRLGRDVTFNAGLRYDLQRFAKPQVQNPDPQLTAANIDTSFLPTDTNNWGPRLGIAWSPSGKPYVARGGYGVFYGRTPSIMVGTAHSNNGINVQTITFTGNQVPVYPAVFPSLPTGVALPKPTIFNFDRNYQNARIQQASAGFEYQVMAQTSVAINYLYVKGDNLPRSTDINVGGQTPTVYTVAGTGVQVPYYRFSPGPFTNFARIISFQSTAVSEYNGLTLELNRRFASHLSARAAYTIGKVTDTVPDATAVVPGSSSDDAKYASNPRNFDADRTVGNNDQRHRFVFSGIYDTNGLANRRSGLGAALLRGWDVSAIFTAASGQPYSARVGNVDLNNDGNTRNDLAPGTTRNQFLLPASRALDIRIAREIPIAGRMKVQPILEVFNLLNSDNVNLVNTTYFGVTTATNTLTPNASFGQALGTAGQRISQIAVRVTF